MAKTVPSSLLPFPADPFAAVAVDMAFASRPTIALASQASPENTVFKDVAPEPGARIANTAATVRTIHCATANRVTAAVRMDGSEITVRRLAPVDTTEHCAKANVIAIPADVIRKAENVCLMTVS